MKLWHFLLVVGVFAVLGFAAYRIPIGGSTVWERIAGVEPSFRRADEKLRPRRAKDARAAAASRSKKKANASSQQHPATEPSAGAGNPPMERLDEAHKRELRQLVRERAAASK